MPELPEVETTCRGLEPYLKNQSISNISVHQYQLRWKISSSLTTQALGAVIKKIHRRGKYILVETDQGTAIWHLGMSGSLRISKPHEALKKHDHVEWRLSNQYVLRYCDPRRFGSLHWTRKNPLNHKLLKDLGVEPLSEDSTGSYLYEMSRGRRVAVKSFIMNSHVVVGVGNIYANEALFASGIDPRRAAGRIGLDRYELLATAIKKVLERSIKQGGTTLKDFVNGNGEPGYFKQQLKVYGRGEEPCVTCGQQLFELKLGQRATVFCKMCQT